MTILELQRYFRAAEEAAREIMLEEAITAQQSSLNGVQVNYSQNDKDGVFQLTTLSALPLKSPKRLIALQLANNNPSFRERFRQKLEQSGGPLNTGSQSHHLGSSSTSTLHDFSNNIISSTALWPQQVGIPNHGTLQLDDQGNYTMLTDGDIEKFMQSPDMGWVHSDSSTSESYGRNKQGESCLSESKLGKKEQQNSSKKETKRGKKGKVKEEDLDERVPASKRKGKRKEDNYGDLELASNGDHQFQQHSTGLDGSSIIKRRRKGELQIMVDGGLGFGGHAPGPLTNAIKNNTNMHSLVGGGISEMGPPGETPRRSGRLKSGGLPSTLSNLNTTFNYLESPFLDKALVDMFSTCGADTPSRLMHLDPPLSKTANTTTGDAIRFDFDEAVAGHFPSPRAGEHLKGSSPSRWSGGSAGSMASGMFSFPDGLLSGRSSGAGLVESEQSGLQQNIYAKKFKKAHKLDSKRESIESNVSNISDLSGLDHVMDQTAEDVLLQSPEPMQQKNPGSSSKVKPSLTHIY